MLIYLLNEYQQCHISCPRLNCSLLSGATVAVETRGRWGSLTVTVVICFSHLLSLSVHPVLLPFSLCPSLSPLILPFLFPLPLCLSPSVPPSRCCSIFKKACSAQVILAAAREGSNKSLMVEKGSAVHWVHSGDAGLHAGRRKDGGDGKEKGARLWERELETEKKSPGLKLGLIKSL